MESQSEKTHTTSSEPANSESPSTDQSTVLNNHTPQPTHVKLGIFLLMALLWAIAIYYFGREYTASPPWFVLLGVVLFSIPIILSGLYLSTVKKIRILAGFASRGWLHRFFSGRVISIFLWSMLAPIATFFLLMQFHAYSPWEWGAFFSVIPLFWIVYHMCRNVAGREMKPYLTSAVALGMARWITPVLAFIIYVAILLCFADVPQSGSLRDVIDARKVSANEMTGSALIFELAQWQANYDGAKDFVLRQLGGAGTTWAILLFSLGGFVVFFNACSMLTCFLIPRHEYRRVFTPLSENIVPAPLEPWRIAVTTGVFTLVVFFIFLPTALWVEKEISVNNKPFEEARQKADFFVMLIDGEYYKPTTRQDIQNIQLQTLKKLDNIRPELNSILELAFMQMERNVDLFLDWYYTLSAEYLRTLYLMTGNADTHIAKELEKHLLTGEPFKNFERKILESIALQQSTKKQYMEDIKSLLDQNRIEPPEDMSIVFVEKASLTEVLTPPAHIDTIDLGSRLGTSGAAGGAAGVATAVIVKKVVAKVSAKGAFKAATKAIVKIASSKAASVATGGTAGAATGAAIGSIFPGIGNVVGALIGAVGGLLVGVTVDKGMLMLEEAISREDFKKDILSGIRSARDEYKAQLNQQ